MQHFVADFNLFLKVQKKLKEYLEKLSETPLTPRNQLKNCNDEHCSVLSLLTCQTLFV